jgi:hypothetical protein
MKQENINQFVLRAVSFTTDHATGIFVCPECSEGNNYFPFQIVVILTITDVSFMKTASVYSILTSIRKTLPGMLDRNFVFDSMW